MRGPARIAGAVVSVGILAATAWGAATAGAQEIEVNLVGFLVLPAAGRPVPSGEATGRLEVPNEQGGARLIFPVEITRGTEVAGRTARSGQLVMVEGVLHEGRVRILRLRDVQVIEYAARISLPEGPLVLPVAADRIVEVVLEGTSTLAVTVLLTPRTMSRQTRLRDGQPVILALVTASKVVVEIEGRD